MTHVQQPRRSKVCGQACVAMLAGVTLDGAVYACTGRRRRPTSEHDLRRGLSSFGLALTEFCRYTGDAGSVPRLVGRALLRIRGNGHGYHWVVLANGLVHDPAFAHPHTVRAFERYLRRSHGRVTSWARVQVGVQRPPLVFHPDAFSLVFERLGAPQGSTRLASAGLTDETLTT